MSLRRTCALGLTEVNLTVIPKVASVWDRVGHRVLMQVLGFSVVQFFVVAACSVAFSRPKDKEEDLQEN